MKFIDVIENRRSNRFLLSDPIPKDKIDYILKVAQLAPVALGKYENIKLLVVEGNTLRTLQEEFCKLNGRDNTYGGGALIVVLHKGDYELIANQDAGIIGDHICLAAAELGLGNVYLHSLVDMMNQNKFINKELLNISDEYKVMCAVTLGFKDNDKVRDVSHKMDIEYFK